MKKYGRESVNGACLPCRPPARGTTIPRSPLGLRGKKQFCNAYVYHIIITGLDLPPKIYLSNFHSSYFIIRTHIEFRRKCWQNAFLWLTLLYLPQSCQAMSMNPCIDGLVQERRNSRALAMELRLSCTNPSVSSHPISANNVKSLI